MSTQTVEELIEAGAVVAIVVGGWATVTRSGLSRWRHESIARRRTGEAAHAALVASADHEFFDPGYIADAVIAMLDGAAATWSDRAGESKPVGVRLEGALGNWATTHFCGPGSELRGAATVDLLRVINREDEDEDRVVVRVRFAIRRSHAERQSDPKVQHHDERWTLAHGGARWRLVEFDAQPLADELLASPQIGATYEDTQRLSQQSLEELARESGPVSSVAGLTDTEAAPYAQLLDLSLVDGRFSPAFIEATLTALVEAWDESATDSRQPLQKRATDTVVAQLLAPHTSWPSARLALLDPALTEWRPVTITTADPAEVTVEATVTAVRYLVDPAGTPIAGATDIRHEIELRWTLRQTEGNPSWQLAETSNPATEIPGAGDG